MCMPIDKGVLPYGMVGKIQAIKSDGKGARKIAESVFNAIIDNDKSRIEYTRMLINLILNNKNEELINQWISVLLRINTVERADVEYFNSHVPDIVNLISEKNLANINQLFIDNGLQTVGLNSKVVVPEIFDPNGLPF